MVGNLVKLVDFILPAFLQCELLKPSNIKNIVCETYKIGCILPAILSDPLIIVAIDLVADKNGDPSITHYLLQQCDEVAWWVWLTGSNQSVGRINNSRYQIRKAR